jgi:hypothetical protein
LPKRSSWRCFSCLEAAKGWGEAKVRQGRGKRSSPCLGRFFELSFILWLRLLLHSRQPGESCVGDVKCCVASSFVMSVFQLHDWWSTLPNSSSQEDFDIGSLAIGNIDNANPPAGRLLSSTFLFVDSVCLDKIVTGSQQGILRIYAPQRPDFRGESVV